MKKNKPLKIVLIFMLVVGIGWCSGLFKTHYNSLGSYVVVKKNFDNRGYTIDVERLSGATNTSVSTIKVKDMNVWNLIEEGRGYLIGCNWIAGEVPTLTQIKNDDEFVENLNNFKANIKND